MKTSQSADAATPAARAMLDIGCGAGNFTLKLLERLPNLVYVKLWIRRGTGATVYFRSRK